MKEGKGMKNALIQYIDLKKEIQDIEQRIERLSTKRDRIIEQGNVLDAVKGGDGGLQTFHIEGFPLAEYEETKYLLNKNIRVLEERKRKAAEQVVEVEKYISTITDSRMRRMITYRYIEGKSWNQVAKQMGGRATGDSVRMELKRFLKNN